MKRVLSLLLSTTMVLTNIVPIFAAEAYDDVFIKAQESTSLKSSKSLKPTSVEMIQALDEASRMFGEGIISQKEYESMLLDIYQINVTTRAVNDDDYYPEVQAGYINYEGVVYLYEEGLRNAKTVEAAISALFSVLPGAGWGVTAMGIAVAAGGKTAFEKAVEEAYYSGKGIAVYYQIHHSVQSLNKVRYVVE